MRYIKKYNNRKLYDAIEKRYVILSEVQEFIEQGQTVQVVDQTNSEDVTANVLLQTLLIMAKDNPPTSEQLHNAVKKGGFKEVL